MPNSLFSGSKAVPRLFLPEYGEGLPSVQAAQRCRKGVSPCHPPAALFSDPNSQTLHSCVCSDPMWPFPGITTCWGLISLVRSFAFIPPRRRKVGSSPDWKRWADLPGQTSFWPTDRPQTLRSGGGLRAPVKAASGSQRHGVSTADLQAYCCPPFPPPPARLLASPPSTRLLGLRR